MADDGDLAGFLVAIETSVTDAVGADEPQELPLAINPPPWSVSVSVERSPVGAFFERNQAILSGEAVLPLPATSVIHKQLPIACDLQTFSDRLLVIVFRSRPGRTEPMHMLKQAMRYMQGSSLAARKPLWQM